MLAIWDTTPTGTLNIKALVNDNYIALCRYPLIGGDSVDRSRPLTGRKGRTCMTLLDFLERTSPNAGLLSAKKRNFMQKLIK